MMKCRKMMRGVDRSENGRLKEAKGMDRRRNEGIIR